MFHVPPSVFEKRRCVSSARSLVHRPCGVWYSASQLVACVRVFCGPCPFFGIHFLSGLKFKYGHIDCPCRECKASLVVDIFYSSHPWCSVVYQSEAVSFLIGLILGVAVHARYLLDESGTQDVRSSMRPRSMYCIGLVVCIFLMERISHRLASFRQA